MDNYLISLISEVSSLMFGGEYAGKILQTTDMFGDLFLKDVLEGVKCYTGTDYIETDNSEIDKEDLCDIIREVISQNIYMKLKNYSDTDADREFVSDDDFY